MNVSEECITYIKGREKNEKIKEKCLDLNFLIKKNLKFENFKIMGI